MRVSLIVQHDDLDFTSLAIHDVPADGKTHVFDALQHELARQKHCDNLPPDILKPARHRSQPVVGRFRFSGDR